MQRVPLRSEADLSVPSLVLRRTRTRVAKTRISRRLALARVTGRESGYTLLELMIAVLILAILLAITVPSLLGFRTRAWDRTAQANLRKVLPSLEAYKQDQGTYVGMTPDGLRTTYDPSINVASYTINNLTATSYCIHTSAGLRTWRRQGPTAPFTFGSC